MVEIKTEKTTTQKHD